MHEPRDLDSCIRRGLIAGRVLFTVSAVILLLIAGGAYSWLASRRSVVPQALVSTPNPTQPLQTPGAVPSLRPSLPVLAPPVTTLPSAEVITPSNANRVHQRARWGLGQITAVAWSPEGLWGPYLAVGTPLGIHVYDATNLVETQFLQTPAAVNSTAFSPDGQLLAAGLEDNQVRLWRVSTGAALRTLEWHSMAVRSVAFAPDGQTLASGSRDGTVRLWRVSDGHLRYTVATRMLEVESVAFSPDGTILAAGSQGGAVWLWRAGDGALLRTVEASTNWPMMIAFAPDGQTLVSGSSDGMISRWRVSDGALIWATPSHSNVISLAFSPDGLFVASGSWDGVAYLWQASDGSLARSATDLGSQVHLAFSPHGGFVLLGSATGLRRWDTRSGDVSWSLKDYTSGVYSVSWSPDGQIVASGSEDGAIRLWQAGDGRLLRKLEDGRVSPVGVVAFAPKNGVLASGSADGTVKLWQLDSGTPRTLQRFSGSIRSLAFSPDGQILAAGPESPDIYLWRVTDGSFLRALRGPHEPVVGLAFSPDGATLASIPGDGTVRLWNVGDGSLLRSLRAPASSLAFSPDGQTLVLGITDVELWRVSDGSLLARLRGHTESIRSQAFSPRGDILASASSDGTVRLWWIPPSLLGLFGEVEGASLNTLRGHAGAVTSVALSPDGRFVVSGSDDGTICLWGVE